MTPKYLIVLANALDFLRKMESNSVQCVITSPPYWALRDYETGTWEGGDMECDHLMPAVHGYNPSKTSTLGPKRDGISASNSAHSDRVKRKRYGSVCKKCGAVRTDHQIGLEATPAEYVAVMVEIFTEIRRVLKKDGTLWLNLGDNYANSGGSGKQGPTGQRTKRRFTLERPYGTKPPAGFKRKDMMGMPWRVAFALQEAGWWLRQDIIWHKTNPTPENIEDRCTKSHEYMFLLSKSAHYYYDHEAIKEPVSKNSHARISKKKMAEIKAHRDAGGLTTQGVIGEAGPKAAAIGRDGLVKGNASFDTAMSMPVERRNKRSVWTVATVKFPGAHRATFPPKLIEPCVLAGTKPGDVILDPFCGTGTVGYVALKHRRSFIGIELNEASIAMAHERIGKLQVELF